MNYLYSLLKYTNDLKAIFNNRIFKRIGWRVSGKYTNKFLNKLFK